MKHVFLLTSTTKESEIVKVADSYRGGELVILIVPHTHAISSSFDRELNALKARAKRLASALKARGVVSKALVEWGSGEEALRNCAARENALPLKP
jgi:hypothetical protein